MIEIQYPKVYLYKRIVQAKLFIDKNFADKIDIDNISNEAFFSKYHFIRLFKQIYGKTPHQYLISVRIDKAKCLLEEIRNVSEVCFLVGFDSIGSFSSLFKRFVGISPFKYLLQMQAKRSMMNEKPQSFIPGCFVFKHGWQKNSNFEENL